MFARSRCVVEVRPGEKAGVYIGRRQYTDLLDAHAAGDGPPLVVLGESGSGKSAVLANWATSYREAHPREFVLMHFIGATPASADWAAMLWRFLGEFNRRFELKIEIPDKPEELRTAFASALRKAAAKGRVILILDGLNQLEDRDHAPDLVWLPPVLPAGVRLIVSTLPGRPLDELRKRGWPALQVEPLNLKERKQLVVQHLAQSVHSLDPARVQKIAGACQTASPLYLRTLLEELMLWGDHLTLDQRITHYLSAPAVPDLYRRILERYEEDYERDRPGLVRDAFSLISAARRGLSESELLDMLGPTGGRLPEAIWSPLSLAAERSLLNRSGLIGFSHSYFRQAVRDKYLAAEAEQHTAHLRIADYFDRQDVTDRKVDELPWQLLQANSWDRLTSVLTDLPFLAAAHERDYIQVAIYWQNIEARSSIRRTAAYNGVLESPDQYAHDLLFPVTAVFFAGSCFHDALRLTKAMAQAEETKADTESLLSALYLQVRALTALGQPDVALSVSRRGVEVSRQSGNTARLFEWLGTEGDLLMFFRNIEALHGVVREQQRVADQRGDLGHINIALNNQSVLLRLTGEADRSLELEKQIERNARKLGNLDDLIRTKGAQATILQSKGQIDDALELIEEQERLLRIGWPGTR